MPLIVFTTFFINSIVIMRLSPSFAFGMKLPEAPPVNSETLDLLPNNLTDDPSKEMYVIHAMVYQVGIITNKTKDEAANNTGIMGNQEALTFYHTNGSGIDLSGIPEPLVTNVTAESMVGVAPTTIVGKTPSTALSWAELKKLVSSQQDTAKSETSFESRHPRGTTDNDYHYDAEEGTGEYSSDDSLPYFQKLYKRSLGLHSKEASDRQTPIKIETGSAEIPQEAGVKSLVIPPLLAMNNNLQNTSAYS